MLILDEQKDVIQRHSFNATGHTVKMYNTIYVSSRAMVLTGCDPETLDGIRNYLAKFYNEYVRLRMSIVPTDKAIERHHLDTLLQAYCGFIKSNSAVCDYKVRIMYNEYDLYNKSIGA